MPDPPPNAVLPTDIQYNLALLETLTGKTSPSREALLLAGLQLMTVFHRVLNPIGSRSKELHAFDLRLVEDVLKALASADNRVIAKTAHKSVAKPGNFEQSQVEADLTPIVAGIVKQLQDFDDARARENRQRSIDWQTQQKAEIVSTARPQVLAVLQSHNWPAPEVHAQALGLRLFTISASPREIATSLLGAGKIGRGSKTMQRFQSWFADIPEGDALDLWWSLCHEPTSPRSALAFLLEAVGFNKDEADAAAESVLLRTPVQRVIAIAGSLGRGGLELPADASVRADPSATGWRDPPAPGLTVFFIRDEVSAAIRELSDLGILVSATGAVISVDEAMVADSRDTAVEMGLRWSWIPRAAAETCLAALFASLPALRQLRAHVETAYPSGDWFWDGGDKAYFPDKESLGAAKAAAQREPEKDHLPLGFVAFEPVRLGGLDAFIQLRNAGR